MPAEMERQLKAAARKKGYKGDRADRYVYGTISKLYKRVGKSWKKKAQRTK